MTTVQLHVYSGSFFFFLAVPWSLIQMVEAQGNGGLQQDRHDTANAPPLSKTIEWGSAEILTVGVK